LKPERWGSPLVQEKYREEMPVTGEIIIIIIIIIIITREIFIISDHEKSTRIGFDVMTTCA